MEEERGASSDDSPAPAAPPQRSPTPVALQCNPSSAPQSMETRLLCRLLELVSDVMFSILSIDPNDGMCTILHASPGVRYLLGYTPAEYMALGCGAAACGRGGVRRGGGQAAAAESVAGKGHAHCDALSFSERAASQPRLRGG